MPFQFSAKGVVSQVFFTWRALRHRNYRLFFMGQIVSLIGTWLSSVATSWLVYRLCRETMPDRAPMMLGLVGFTSQIPIFLITPWAGVWIDRLDRHKILIATQVVSMLQSFALAYLALWDIITIPQIFLLSAVQGLVNAFDMPTRQSFVVEMVEDRKDLSNAIALNSSMVHTARLVGPSVAGFLIYHVGEGMCFLIDGFSYFAVIVALLLIRVKAHISVAHRPAQQELREGISYALGSAPIRALLILVATVSLMFTSQSVLMPIIAAKVLGGSERTLGMLLGASGAGALAASLYLASRASVIGLLSKVVVPAVIALGFAFILLSLSRQVELSVIFLFFTGGTMVLLNASCNTVLQTIVEDEKRGRIMSFFSLAFLGMAPFGSLFAGGMASLIGAPATFTVCGVISLISGYAFIRKLPRLKECIRPIYQRKGILPPEVE